MDVEVDCEMPLVRVIWILTHQYQIKAPEEIWVGTMHEGEHRMTPEKEMSTATKSTPDVLKEIQMVHRDGKHSSHWSMSASSGRSYFRCTFITRSEKFENLVCSLIISSDFWRRGLVDFGKELTNDLKIELPQVLLEPEAVKALQLKLNDWLENGELFTIDLEAREEGDQKLRIGIELDKNLLCSTSKPAFTVAYSSGSIMQGRWSFLVDQSCIRSCLEEIIESLGSI